MPHIIDLSQNVIWEGNNGERWQVTDSTSDTKQIVAILTRLPVVERVEELRPFLPD